MCSEEGVVWGRAEQGHGALPRLLVIVEAVDGALRDAGLFFQRRQGAWSSDVPPSMTRITWLAG
ncbi:MAG TPA: hypothetical protein VH817_23025 [Thermoleophilaceae bacterium]